MSKFLRPSTMAALAIAAVGMAGCATPTAPHIYTLQDRGAPSRESAQGGPVRFIDVAPIVLPERLKRPQIVLRTDSTQLRVLEQDRWSAALPDELRDAISAGLQSRLGAIDIAQAGSAGKGDAYRVSIEFSQLDAQLGGDAKASVTWSVKLVSGDKGQVCQASFSEPAGATVGAVVEAHQRLVGKLMDAVAASARAAESGGSAPYCSAVN